MRRFLAALALVVGCQLSGSGAPTSGRIELGALDVETSSRPAELPSDEESFLRALLPLPEGDVRITYDVSGPAGMHGELTVVARAGGYRNERWAMELPVPPEEGQPEPVRDRVRGARIIRPDAIWTDAVQGSATVRPSGLRGIARAYLDLDPGLRSLVAFRVAQWHAELERGRADHPGDEETVLGHTCLVTRAASHRVCVWERTGLPLYYDGDAFSLRARGIETHLSLEDGLFEIPDGAQRVLDDRAEIAGPDAIAKLAAGDYAELAGWISPAIGSVAP